jgi:hypothetical protein
MAGSPETAKSLRFDSSSLPGVFKASALSERSLRLPPEIADAFPRLSLTFGRTVTCRGASAVSLSLRLAAQACPAASWTAVIAPRGLINPAAAREAELNLERTMWVNVDHKDAASAAAMCMESCAVVVVSAAINQRDARRLQARAMNASSVLILINTAAVDADLAFITSGERWEGLLGGYGYLKDREFELEVKARHSAPMQPRVLRLNHVSHHA